MRTYLIYSEPTKFISDFQNQPLTFDTYNGAKSYAINLFEGEVFSIVTFDMDTKELISANIFNLEDVDSRISILPAPYYNKLEELYYALEFPAT